MGLKNAWIPSRKKTIHIDRKMGLFREQTVNHTIILEHSYRQEWKSRLSHIGRHLACDLMGKEAAAKDFEQSDGFRGSLQEGGLVYSQGPVLIGSSDSWIQLVGSGNEKVERGMQMMKLFGRYFGSFSLKCTTNAPSLGLINFRHVAIVAIQNGTGGIQICLGLVTIAYFLGLKLEDLTRLCFRHSILYFLIFCSIFSFILTCIFVY